MYPWILDLAHKSDDLEDLRKRIDRKLGTETTDQMGEEFLNEAFIAGNTQASEQFYIDKFIDKINKNSGLKDFLREISEDRESFYGVGLPRVVLDASRNISSLTDEDLDSVRSAIYKDNRKIARGYYYGVGQKEAILQFRTEDLLNDVKEDKFMAVEDRLKIAALAEDRKFKQRILRGDITYLEVSSLYKNFDKELSRAMSKAEALERKSLLNAEKSINQKQVYKERMHDLLKEKDLEIEDKLRKQRKELREAEKNRAAAKAMRERMIFLFRRIPRKVPQGTTDYTYGKKLELIGRLFSDRLTNRTGLEGRAEKLLKIITNFEEYTNDEFPQVLVGLGGLTMDEFTFAQLAEVYETLEELRSFGRKMVLNKNLSRKIMRMNAIKGIRKEILDGDELELFDAIGSKETREKQKSTAMYKLWAATLRPTRMINKLGGPLMEKWFVEYVNKATDKEITHWHRRHEAGVIKMEELGITTKGLARIISYQGTSYSADQVIHIYIGMMNEKSSAAIVFGNNLDFDTIDGLIGQLTEEEKAWGQFMIDDFEENYDRLNQAFIRDKNMDMGKEKAYFPMLRDNLEEESVDLGTEMGEQYAIRNAWRKGYPKKKFTISRIEIADEHQVPIRLGATAIWLGQVDKQEHYIAAQELVKDLQYIQNDQSLKDALKQKYGRASTDWLEKYVNAYASPDIYKVYGNAARVSRLLRNNMAIAYLAFNMLTVLKQAPSIAFYLREAGPQHIINAAYQMITNPKRAIEQVHSMDPQMLVRVYNRILEELKKEDKNPKVEAVRKLGRMGMKPIAWMDSAVTTIGWLATYNAGIGKGLTEVEAARNAQRVTLETQPTARAKDLAQIYRENEIMNWLLMFTNQLNQIWNMWTYDLPTAMHEHEFRKSAGIIAGLGISGISIAFLSGWRPPEDPKEIPLDLANEIFMSYLASISIVGGDIKSGFAGEYFPGGMQIIPAGKSVGTFMGDIKDGDVEHMAKDFVRLLKDAGITAGVPVTAINRGVKTIQNKNLLELLGYGFTQHSK